MQNQIVIVANSKPALLLGVLAALLQRPRVVVIETEGEEVSPPSRPTPAASVTQLRRVA